MTFIQSVCVYDLLICTQSLVHIIRYYHQIGMCVCIYIYHVVEITAVLHSQCSYEELCTLPRPINKHHFMSYIKPFKCHTHYNMQTFNSSQVAELSALRL